MLTRCAKIITIHLACSSEMKLYEIIWKDQFVEKLVVKHNVVTDEVEQVLFSSLLIRKAKKGQVKGEDVYAAYGQTF